MKDKNHDRAPDKTAISVSMPKALKAEIKRAAKHENRSVSNFITHYLEQIVSENDAPKKKAKASVVTTVSHSENSGKRGASS
jgi:metal-responsive CopG/Arc/MetJ family transcriptional regulator